MRAVLGVVLVGLVQVRGHGMVWDPPNRSSMWRFGYPVPVNYEDNENYCGGFGVQWDQNAGKCGVCGDPYQQRRPRDNENGGKYGSGIVSKTYSRGATIPVTVRMHTAHAGYFTFQLCDLSGSGLAMETDDCFQELKFADGSDRYLVTSSKDYKVQLDLPQQLTCKQCVLRWHYRTGNSWGECEDGSEGMGCGAQEVFRSCSDIAIQ